MLVKNLFAILSFILSACNNSVKDSVELPNDLSNNIAFKNIEAIPLPNGYNRIDCDNHSFGAWLRKVTLKNSKTVFLYNGEKKKNQSAQFAVLDISVGSKDLQQCADAIMRLRAEYLFSEKRYSEIVFSDNNGKEYKFEEPYTHENLLEYLQIVFAKCGSASLSKQLHNKLIAEINPGDVLIKGGFPGHAVIVMDVATNNLGNRVYLIAQSYMPAQDIHVLVNFENHNLSPWYAVDLKENIYTPEFIFTNSQVKSW